MPPGNDASPGDGGTGDAGVDGDGGPLPGPRGNLRVMAANISSGPQLDYGAAENVHIFQGLDPDVVLIQELNVGGNSQAELDGFVTTTFGATYTYYREPGAQIPNGVISRFPIETAGTWVDPQVANRGFAYARLTVPGGHPLWAISLHLLTSSASQRDAEATSLVTQIKATIPAEDLLVLGGDFNTGSRGEGCITTLSQVVVTAAPYPADNTGNDATSGTRSKPHDWLLADPDLQAHVVPVVIGAQGFAAGLVFDSRVYQPLTDVAPIVRADSDAQNMQHMPVVRDFLLP
ncbi:MAG: endonuclease/exonuclease/phosphatase family [Labilithrix sp.]|nr:endonuclease/exonuclease/phosphatase family [Labilithrix sp.]